MKKIQMLLTLCLFVICINIANAQNLSTDLLNIKRIDNTVCIPDSMYKETVTKIVTLDLESTSYKYKDSLYTKMNTKDSIQETIITSLSDKYNTCNSMNDKQHTLLINQYEENKNNKELIKILTYSTGISVLINILLLMIN